MNRTDPQILLKVTGLPVSLIELLWEFLVTKGCRLEAKYFYQPLQLYDSEDMIPCNFSILCNPAVCPRMILQIAMKGDRNWNRVFRSCVENSNTESLFLLLSNFQQINSVCEHEAKDQDQTFHLYYYMIFGLLICINTDHERICSIMSTQDLAQRRYDGKGDHYYSNTLLSFEVVWFHALMLLVGGNSLFTELFRGSEILTIRDSDKLTGILIQCLEVFLSSIPLNTDQHDFNITKYLVSFANAVAANPIMSMRQKHQIWKRVFPANSKCGITSSSFDTKTSCDVLLDSVEEFTLMTLVLEHYTYSSPHFKNIQGLDLAVNIMKDVTDVFDPRIAWLPAVVLWCLNQQKHKFYLAQEHKQEGEEEEEESSRSRTINWNCLPAHQTVKDKIVAVHERFAATTSQTRGSYRCNNNNNGVVITYFQFNYMITFACWIGDPQFLQVILTTIQDVNCLEYYYSFAWPVRISMNVGRIVRLLIDSTVTANPRDVSSFVLQLLEEGSENDHLVYEILRESQYKQPRTTTTNMCLSAMTILQSRDKQLNQKLINALAYNPGPTYLFGNV